MEKDDTVTFFGSGPHGEEEDGKKHTPKPAPTGGSPRDESNVSEPESTSHHDDDDAQQLEEKSASNVKKTKTAAAAAPMILGGSIEKAAFCLLQGFMDEPDNSNKNSPNSSSNSNAIKQPVLVPIDRLPALLGRSHQTTNQNFFGLGKNIKAVSRVQFCIDYRIPGGTIGQVYNATDGSSKFTYQPYVKKEKDGNEKEQAVTILNPTNAIQDEAGFYAITCKGKNPIRVNGLKVDQDQTCLLTHGSDIKISAFSLYFLLPGQPSTKTMQVTVNIPNERSSENGDAATKKRKAPSTEMVSSTSPTAERADMPKELAKRRRFPNQSLQDDLDKMTTDELLNEINTSVEKGNWDRRCGFMGSTILYRAVLEASQARKIQESVKTTDGVSKAAITAWIHASAKFGYCLQLMQTKLEKKSYQCSIARAMQRAGYTRCSDKSFGRHVRWKLPQANVDQHQQYHGLNRSPGPRETDGQQLEEEEEDEAASDDNDEDDNSEGASQDDASQEDKVADGNDNDSDDDDDDDDDDGDGVEGSDGVTGGAWKKIKAEIDASSTDMLLEEFDHAIEHNRWDRRCQFVATTVANRAVKEAARSADFRQCAEPDGVSRAQVVDWITKSARYGKWAEYMAEKLKPRSYQANIVKSMQLAGFHRSSVKTFGCNIRWHLPDVSSLDENVDDDDDGDDDDSDDDDDEDGGSGTGSDAQSQGSVVNNVQQADSGNDSSDDDDSDNDNNDDAQ